MAENCSRAKIGIRWIIRGKVKESNKGAVYLGDLPIAWSSGGFHIVDTSSYAGEMQSAFLVSRKLVF